MSNNNITEDPTTPISVSLHYSASEMTYIVSSGALNSTHSLTPVKCQCLRGNNWNHDDFCNNTF